MAIDIYSTRAQLAAIEVMPPEHTFLYDMFVRELAPVEDDKAIWDFRKGSQMMAPIIHDGTGGVLMERDGYSTREISFCTIAPERNISKHDIKGRYYGEQVLGAMTPEQRAKKLQADDLKEMRAAIQRRREWMARQVLLTGKMNIFEYTNEGRNLHTTMVADYQFTNVYTPTAWDQSGAKVEYDLRRMNDLVSEGGSYVDIIVMDGESAQAMRSNDSFMKQLDMRNVNMGDMNTRYVGAGVYFEGRTSIGTEIYSVSGKFRDDGGVFKPIIPRGTVIAGSKGMLKGIHGPVTQVESYGQDAQHKTYIKKEVPLRYGSIESNAIMNRLTSRFTVVPFNVDAWCVATVL